MSSSYLDAFDPAALARGELRVLSVLSQSPRISRRDLQQRTRGKGFSTADAFAAIVTKLVESGDVTVDGRDVLLTDKGRGRAHVEVLASVPDWDKSGRRWRASPHVEGR